MTILRPVLFALALCACSDTTPGSGADLAPAATSDLASASPAADMAGAGDMALPSNADLASAKLALCQVCANDTDCESGACISYMSGAVKKCSHSCSAGTASTDCPGVNACNGMAYCKCP